MEQVQPGELALLDERQVGEVEGGAQGAREKRVWEVRRFRYWFEEEGEKGKATVARAVTHSSRLVHE